jgi:glycerol-3-phosphate O-acyltransferase
VPLVAAGANLSFFPLGPLFRRGGAFFLRRSFRGDAVYTAAFRAYIKRLVHEGVHQEFFLEGGRSRTGKLLTPKLGLLTWEVDAVLEGASNDIYFVPVAIDYERVVESSSYSEELAGAEKKPENIRALLSTPKVLRSNYGRIHLHFDEPVSLVDFMESRGLSTADTNEDAKRGLVRALGNRIIYGISRVSTVTPHALLSAALLAHRGRGVSAAELSRRIGALLRIAEEEGRPISSLLLGAPLTPTAAGPIQDAMGSLVDEEAVRIEEVKGEPIYLVAEERRAELSYYKNTLMNLVAPRSLVARAALSSSSGTREEVQEGALFLSRLLKRELVYRVGATFDALFAEALEGLRRAGLVEVAQGQISIPSEEQRDSVAFLADLLRDLVEGYLAAALTLKELAPEHGMERRTFVKAAIESGRAEYLAGRIAAPESLSKATMENAALYLLDERILIEDGRRLRLGPTAATALEGDQLANRIRSFLNR